jgi:hypothetical protein
MTPKSFVSTLAATELPSVFNPWRDRCTVHDRSDAAARRRDNLEMLLTAALDHRVETIWIARDLGYRGGRRTGVPLTDEIHLGHAGTLMGGIAFERATQGPAVAERTAAIVSLSCSGTFSRSIPMKRMIRCRTDATREASARRPGRYCKPSCQ